MIISRLVKTILPVAFVAGIFCNDVFAQEDSSDADELAAKLSNPTAAVGSMNLFVDYKAFTGNLAKANEQNSWSLLFQPGLPKPLSIGFNLLFRPAIPIVVKQPIPAIGNDNAIRYEDVGVDLGNITFDLALGKTTEKGLLYFFGVVGAIPSATTEKIRGQWAFGPELALGVFKKTFVGGALISQQWGVENVDESKGEVKTNVLGGQYFYAIPIGKGKVIGAGPTFAYDWESEQFTLPIGTGYSKTTTLGKLPFKYGIQVWYYVEQAEAFGPEWLIRIQLTPVVPLPW